MRVLLLLLASCLLITSTGLGQAIIPFGLYHNKSVQFSGTAEALTTNVCSAAVYVGPESAGNLDSASGATVSFSTSGSIQVYSDASCTTTTSTATITNWPYNYAEVYVMMTANGTGTVTASMTGYQSTARAYTSSASNFIWKGTTNSTWSTGTNWSGGSAPGASDVAIFDNSCTGCNATITAGISVKGIKMMSTYTGTITQNSGSTITLGSAGHVQNGGTFLGTTGGTAISQTGPFALTAGTYQATSGTWTLQTAPATPSFVISGSPTFTHNNGTLSVAFAYETMTMNMISGAAFNNVTWSNHQGSLNLTGTWTINGTLTLDDLEVYGGYFSGGQIDLSGNLVISDYGNYGSTILNIKGSSSQSITSTGATTPRIPSVYFNSTGGTVTITGDLSGGWIWKWYSGTISSASTNLSFDPICNTGDYIWGSNHVNNVKFTNNCSGSSGFSGTLNIDGNLTIDRNSPYGGFNSGTFKVKGDVILLNYGMGGSTVVDLVGTTNQKIDASGANDGTAGEAYVPAITVDSTGGTVSLLGTIWVSGSWIWNSGTLSAGTSVVKMFCYGWQTITFTPGGQTYYDLTMLVNNGPGANITGNLTVGHNMTLGDGSQNMFIDMPNPGTGYTLSVTGTLTVSSSTFLSLHGATKTQGTLVNNGTINP